ncbi:hypothetical protein L5G32_08450 [Gordonia sp. HY002]|uniref:hypothetical protein n=1 Tax=Gordonia zhenghanii TaxID=2911516 RepID=UPI001EF0884D|nr:hypothetical protein [Gordonia zhenghanii]MCF8570295.1 hypothetical protein [Gordonia zhenghanii]MCF8605554.1 hypothetical protein [Gordonia zhenghanii]
MADFGITPTQIAQIVADWRELGDEIVRTRLPDPPTTATSRTVAAAAIASTKAAAVSSADGLRLVALADALDRFNGLSQESDSASAAAIGDVTRDNVR